MPADKNRQQQWYALSIEEMLSQTTATSNGLSSEAAARKLQQVGPNELIAGKKINLVKLFFKQFFDVMVLVLIIAAVVSAFIGEAADTIVIIVILVLNAVIGFFQEYRAEQAMDALRKMAAPTAKVERDEKLIDIPAAALVPGDLIYLEAGNTAAADIRLLTAVALKTNEASLTGESTPVDKNTAIPAGTDLALGDQFNMVFKGTDITNGHAKGIVVATGMQTELGRIAGMLDQAESSTPLQNRLSAFSRRLTVIIILLCIGLAVMGYLRAEPWDRLLLTSLSLAVAAIPEALPAVVSVALALGARRLARKQVLIRRLYAVEALGSVTYICTDKTGTLTRNKMEVKEVWAPDDICLPKLLQAMSLNHDTKEVEGKTTGDPTEIAMLEFAGDQESVERVRDIPFDADRKAMTTIHRVSTGYWVITKGAADSLVDNLNGGDVEAIKAQEEKMAREGMRVIAFADKMMPELPDEISPETMEIGLSFVGLAGLIDPPREEARTAITECKTAGIVPVMITGDHPLTAAAIGKQLGMVDDESQVITGRDLGNPFFEEKRAMIESFRAYARVSPEQKLRIVEALQQKGQFVSMTGDGVNDAPSLKQANIGVAMGITGTEVTKEAAGMILLDDNFATIVGAVKEGRRIYDNIRKFIRYILTGNLAEIVAIACAPLFGLPIPLLPVHILWINLVTDGLPALALAAEQPEKRIMQRAPRAPNESIFAQGLGIGILWAGLLIGFLTIATQWYSLEKSGSHWQTMVFTVLCFSQLWLVLGLRSESESLFSTGIRGNMTLFYIVLGTAILQTCVIYLPWMNRFFHTEALSFVEFLQCLGISFLVLVAVELEKRLKN